MWRHFVRDASTLRAVGLYRRLDAHSRGEWTLPESPAKLLEAISAAVQKLEEVGVSRAFHAGSAGDEFSGAERRGAKAESVV